MQAPSPSHNAWKIRLRMAAAALLFTYIIFLSSRFGLSFPLHLAIRQVAPILILGGWLLSLYRRGRPFPFTGLETPLAFWILGIGLSSLLSPLSRWATESFIYNWLWPSLWLYLLVDLIRRRWGRHLWFGLYANVSIAAVVMLNQQLQAVHATAAGAFRLFWLKGYHQSVHSVWMALLIPPMVGQAIESRGIRRWGAILWSVFGTVVLILSFARVGFLSLITSLITGTFLVWRGEGQRLLRRLWARRSARLALVLGALTFLAIGVLLIAPQLTDPGNLSGDMVRLVLWRQAVTFALQRPLTGIGPGAYFRLAWQEMPGDFSRGPLGPHSLYAGLLAEGGLIGVAGAIWTAWVLIKIALRFLDRMKGQAGYPRHVGVLASLGGFAAAAAVDDRNLWLLSLPALFLLASILAPALPSPSRHRKRPWLVGATAALIVPLLYLSYTDVAWRSFERARQAAQQMNWTRAAELAERAAAIDRGVPLYPIQAAEFWYPASTSPDSLCPPPPDATDEDALTAAERNARSVEGAVGPFHLMNRAAILWTAGDRSAAIDSMEQAIQLSSRRSPFMRPLLLLNLGCLHETQGETEEATAAYSEAIRLAPRLSRSGFWETTDFRREELPLIIRRIEESDASSHLALALAQNDWEAAEDAVGRLSDEDPTRAREGRGWIALHAEDTEAAQAAGDWLVEAQPASAIGYLIRGRANALAGCEAAAVRDLETAYYLAPSNDEHASQAAYGLWTLSREEAWARRTLSVPTVPIYDTVLYQRHSYTSYLPGIAPVFPLPLDDEQIGEMISWYAAQGDHAVAQHLCDKARAYDPYSRARLDTWCAPVDAALNGETDR